VILSIHGTIRPNQEESTPAFGKIKAIRERIGLVLTHDEISYLCAYIWHCSDPSEFYGRMDSLSDEELRRECEKTKYRKKPNLLEHESMLYA
jgi:hypothetical protein